MIAEMKSNKVWHWNLPKDEGNGCDMKIDCDRLFFTLKNSHQVFIYKLNGEEIGRFGGFQFGKKPGEFSSPSGLTVNHQYLYICDTFNHRIQKLDKKNGTFMKQFGTKGICNGQLTCPTYIHFDRIGELLYIGDMMRISVFDQNGLFIRYLGKGSHEGNGLGEFRLPMGICAAGPKVCILDWGNSRVQVFI